VVISMTKRVLVICRDCGKEERISVYSREEAPRADLIGCRVTIGAAQ
jgi:RNase P subunit RPR2